MLFFVPMLGLLGIGIAMIRRSSRPSMNGPSEEVAERLLRWAVGLLSAQRAEWGQAMLGELDHIDGRGRRMRFTLGCVVAALLLPPWGRAAAAVWAMAAVAVGSVGLYASVIVHYGLGRGDWVTMAILAVFLAGFLLAASSLLRRSGVALPGLLGGVFTALVWLALPGFTFYQQIAPDTAGWHQLVIQVALPFAVLGAGGPPDDPGQSTTWIVSDRLGNNLIPLLLPVVVSATVGWAGAAAAGPAAVRMRPATTAVPVPASGPAAAAGMGTSRRTTRTLLLCAMVAEAVLLAFVSWMRG